MARADHPTAVPSTAEAYVHLRSLPGMPATLPEALAVPHWALALRTTAAALLVARQRATLQRPPVLPTTHAAHPAVPRHPPCATGKAAAAGAD